MNSLRHGATLGAVGLILLGLATIALSAMALTRFRQAPDAETASSSASLPPLSAARPSSTASPTPAPSATTPPPTPTPPSSPVASGPTVVIMGDEASVDGSADVWVGPAADQLGWGTVVNLSSPGRGFLAAPAECTFEPCGRFVDTIPAAVKAQPDMVITFGGTADGDYDLSDAAAEYFDLLRQALPTAQLVAISPVTGEDPAPYFLTMHARTIGDAVEAVDGVMIVVGQPGSGDGDALSSEAHAEIARLVVAGLR